MTVYLISAIFSSLFMSLHKKYNSKFFLILSFLTVFLVIALRYGIGYDYLNIYTPIFKSIISGGKSSWEFGITLLCLIIGKFTSDPLPFFVITSFITYYYFYKAIVEKSKMAWLSVLIIIISGIYMDSMNAVRQYISIAIFLYSLKYIESENFFRYLICVVIASLFHNSAIIILPVYFLYKIKYTPLKSLIIIIITLLVFITSSQLFMFILKFTKYFNYVDSAYATPNPTYSELIISTILLIFTLIFFKSLKNVKTYKLYLIITCLFFGVAIFSFKIMLAYRIVMYFKSIMIISIPFLISNIAQPKKKLLYLILWIVMLFSITWIGAYKLNWYDTKYISIFYK